MASGPLRVTHDFHPSPDTDNLYEVTVTLENTSGANVTELLYRRNMDWDIYPTPFSECVTVQPDPSTVDFLEAASSDGFVNSNPYAFLAGNPAPFTDLGPSDIGAAFQFKFNPLASGETTSFNIYYGAAGTQAEAEDAIAAAGLEVFSFGKPSAGGNCTGELSLIE